MTWALQKHWDRLDHEQPVHAESSANTTLMGKRRRNRYGTNLWATDRVTNIERQLNRVTPGGFHRRILNRTIEDRFGVSDISQ